MNSKLSEVWDRHAASYTRMGAPFTGYIAQSLFHTVAGAWIRNRELRRRVLVVRHLPLR